MKVLIETVSSVQDAELQSKPDYITDERWEKILRIRPLEDKKRSLLAGRLLARMCEECRIAGPMYGTVKNGKPVLVSHPEWAFSISHSGEYVVLAYKKNVKSIGVDIQQIKKVSDGLKKRILHERERRYFSQLKGHESVKQTPQDKVVLEENIVLPNTQRLGSEEQITILNRIWAIKESYVKMTGEGLSHDFRRLYIDFEAGTVTDETGRNVSFLEPGAPEGYVLAVAIEV